MSLLCAATDPREDILLKLCQDRCDVARRAPGSQFLGPHLARHGLEIGLHVRTRGDLFSFPLRHRINAGGELLARLLVLVARRPHRDFGIDAERHRASTVDKPIVIAPVLAAIGFDQQVQAAACPKAYSSLAQAWSNEL